MSLSARPLRLLHLVGSAVDDFHADLSRLYAGACLNALAGSADHIPYLAYVSPDGSWRFPTELTVLAIDDAPALTRGEAVSYIKALGIDAMVPQMFCIPGMTTYRALFDAIAIPYLGNPAAVMAAGVDKARTRSIVAAAGVALPAAEILGPGQRPTLPFPVVVKPVDADNSVAVTLVRHSDDYDAAATLALSHSNAVLVETYIELGREVRCGIIVRDGQLVCLPLEEYAMDPGRKPIRTRADKLARTEDGELYLVAKDPDKAWIVADDGLIVQRVWDAARRAHLALGCRHYSLFDFRIDQDGQPWFLEAGLYCSYSPGSVIAVMASAIGVSLPHLFEMGLSEMKRQRQPCLTSPH